MPQYQFTGTAETVYPYAPGGPLTVSPGDVVELAEPYEAAGLVETDELVTVRATEAANEGAGDDGSNSGGDAGEAVGVGPDAAETSSDGADSQDVGPIEPEPAPTVPDIAGGDL